MVILNPIFCYDLRQDLKCRQDVMKKIEVLFVFVTDGEKMEISGILTKKDKSE